MGEIIIREGETLTKENIVCTRLNGSTSVKFMMATSGDYAKDEEILNELCHYLGNTYQYHISYDFFYIPMPDKAPDMAVMQMKHEGPNGAKSTVQRWNEYKAIAYKRWG